MVYEAQQQVYEIAFTYCISCICYRVLWIMTVLLVEFFHNRLEAVHIRGKGVDSKSRNIAITHNCLKIIGREQLTIAHIVIFDPHIF